MIDDSLQMQKKFGMLDGELTRDKLRFRIMSLQKEEMDELIIAFNSNNAEEVVDALIDTIVIALGTLQIFKVDAQKAWTEVWKANMAKERGVKSTRPESGGFDLVKPEGWKPPTHQGNHGVLDEVLS